MGGKRTSERKIAEQAIILVSGDNPNREKVVVELLNELIPSMPQNIKKARSTSRFADRLMAGIFVGTGSKETTPYVWVALSGLFQHNFSLVESYALAALRTRHDWAILLPSLLGENLVSERLISAYLYSEDTSSDIGKVVKAAASFQRAGNFNLAVQRWEIIVHKVAGAKRELSLCYALQEQWALAWYWMLCHLNEYPADPIALSDLAVWLHQLNLPPGAEQLLRQLVTHHRLCPYLWGIIRYLQKRGILLDLKVPTLVANHPWVRKGGEVEDWLKWCQHTRPIVVYPNDR